MLKYQTDLEAGKLLVAVYGGLKELEIERRVTGENAARDVDTYRTLRLGPPRLPMHGGKSAFAGGAFV